MKSIHLSRVTDPSFVEELRNEVRILRDVDHPHIVRPIETYEHRNQIFIVMELCSGGDLYTRDPYTEPEAARIVGNILSAISYMHSRNISHRDLKYENIMYVYYALMGILKKTETHPTNNQVWRRNSVFLTLNTSFNSTLYLVRQVHQQGAQSRS